MATLSKAQIAKARNFFLDAFKAAKAEFIAANTGYKDIVLNMDDVRVVKAYAAKADGRYLQDGELMADKEIAKLRIDYVQSGRSTETLDLLTVKTEKDIPEDKKFQMIPYLPAKRIKVDGTAWKKGYSDPELSYSGAEPANRFIQNGTSETFQVLRAQGLFQLMSDDEIEDFVSEMDIDFDTYWKLFF